MSTEQDKNLSAPSITLRDVDAAIKQEDYYVFPGTTTTVCLLVLVNGFTVIGESACVSVENFDEETGRIVARANACNKVWAYLGYQLTEDLFRNIKHG